MNRAPPNRVTVPTALERAGNFSQTVDTSGQLLFIRDPLKTGTCNITTGGPACFDGNIIPADRITRYGQAMLGLFPMPNFGDISVSNRNYNYQFQDVAHQTKALNHLKLDYKATDRDLFTVSLRKWSPITEGNAGLFGLESNWDQLRHNYAKSEWDWHAKHVRTFGLRLVNEASVGMRQTAEIYTDPDFDAVSKAGYGLAGLPELYPGANFAGDHAAADVRRRAFGGGRLRSMPDFPSMPVISVLCCPTPCRFPLRPIFSKQGFSTSGTTTVRG